MDLPKNVQEYLGFPATNEKNSIQEAEMMFQKIDELVTYNLHPTLEDILNNKVIMIFVINWAVFEKFIRENRILNNNNLSINAENIPEIAKLLSKNIYFEHLREHFEYFYNRYKNSSTNRMELANYISLSSASVVIFNAILNPEKDNPDIKYEKKLAFLIYIIYRLRNNIFHGVKGFDHWVSDDVLITHANEALMQIIFNNYKGGTPESSLKEYACRKQ